MEMMQAFTCCKHSTPFGDIVSIWNDELLFACGWRLQLTENINCSEENLSSNENAQQFATALNDFFGTGRFQWNLANLDWSGYSAFQREVLEACAKIPAGETISYGDLADRVNRAGAARAVGATMAKNRWPLLIPCHRVIGATGQLTGYSGLGGINMKRRLLELEEQLSAGPVDGRLSFGAVSC